MRDYKSEKKHVNILDRYSAFKRGSNTVYRSHSGAIRDSGRSERKRDNFYSRRRFR